MGSMTNAGGMVEGMVKKLAAAWAGLKLAEQVKESVLLAARYETLGVVMGVMGNNAGYTATQMAQFQQGLEATGISMVGARQSLNMMAAAQLNLAQSSDLARVAQDAAVISGTNSTEAFEALTRSIQTGMVIIAHRAGIMVNYQQAEKEFAATLGKTKEQLTNQELSQARLNAVLEEGRKRQGAYEASMNTAGKQLLSMERYIDNVKVRFGEAFTPALSNIVLSLTSALKGTSENLKGLIDSGDMKEFGNKLSDVVGIGISGLGELTKIIIDNKEAIALLATAFVASNLGGIINGWAVSTLQWVEAKQIALATSLSAKEAAMAEAEVARLGMVVKAEEAAIQFKLAQMEADVAPPLKQAAAQKALAQAHQSATVAIGEQIAAESILSKASGAAGAASSFASASLSALGGPIGLITTLLGLGVTAWMLWGNSSKDAATKATVAAKSVLENLREEVFLLREKARVQSGSAVTSQGRIPGMAGASDETATRARSLKDTIDTASKTLDMLSAGYYQFKNVNDKIQFEQHVINIQAGSQKELEALQKYEKEREDLRKKLAPKSDIPATSESEYGSEAKQRESMIQKLREEAATWGMTTEQIRRYNAERLGLGKNADLLELEGLEAARRRDITASNLAAEAADSLKEKHAAAFAERQAQLDYEAQAIQAATDFQAPYMREIEQLGTIYEGLTLKLNAGIISQQEFARQEAELVRLTKQSMPVMTQMFGDLRDTIQDWSRDGSEALADFFMTGEGGFTKMINSWVRDLMVLYAQKQIMDPLIYGSDSGGWGGLLGLFGDSSGETSTTTDMGFGGTNDISGVSMPSYASSSKASASAQVSIGAVHINAATGTATTDGVSGGALAEKVSSAMREAALAVIVDEKRPGGHLEAVGAMG
jgi:hypothetical protein